MKQNFDALLKTVTDVTAGYSDRVSAGVAYVDLCEGQDLLYRMVRTAVIEKFPQEVRAYAQARLPFVAERLLALYLANDRSASNMIAYNIATQHIFPAELRERAGLVTVEDYVARGWQDHLLNLMDCDDFPAQARIRAGALFIDSRVAAGELGAVRIFADDLRIPCEIRAYAREQSL